MEQVRGMQRSIIGEAVACIAYALMLISTYSWMMEADDDVERNVF